MLSMTPLKNAQAAKSYYEKDNYYAKDSKEAAQLSHWWGKGAEKLGLSGYVQVETFEKLLEGQLPSGQQLGRINKKGKAHRPGYDLTFSAPKSISLLAEMGGDHRLYTAHDHAVKEAMAYIEQNAIKTRASHQGEIIFEQVDNITAAIFRHDTSREFDPDTHSHVVLLNLIQREDSKWRSISSESLFDHKMVAGLIYRSFLAVECQKLGYEIEQTHSDGRFEIKGIAKEILEHFSQRRQQIEERLEKEGWEGSKASAKVALDTRKRKVKIDRDNLVQTWQQRCADLNFDPSILIEQAKVNLKQQSFALSDPVSIAYDAVKYAVAHLGEREAVFADRDLIREALAHALGQTTLKHIHMAIQTLNDEGTIIAVHNQCWTTLEAQALEQENIHLMKEGQGQCLPMNTLEVVQNFIKASEKALGKPYTQGQRDAIELIATTSDRVVGVQGSAGTGKTTFLRTLSAIQALASSAGYELIGLAPTKNAAMELEKKTGITAITLQKYIVELDKPKKDKQAFAKPKLIILDESSMASLRQGNKILTSLVNTPDRLVLVGDVKQLSSIDFGKLFYQLQKAGMKTAIMNEIVRQKSPLLKEAIYDAIAGKVLEAFQKIDVTEESNKQKRLQKVVDEYLSYSKEGRERTLVLVPANDDRKIVNSGIRNGLKKEGLLQGNEIQTSNLISRGFSRAYRRRVTNYSVGDIVRFNKSYKKWGITAGDYWKITNITREKNEMQLVQVNGNKTITWNPEKVGGKREGAIEVYQVEKRALMAGDKIRWLRNQGDDFINSQTADVLRVDNHQMEVRLHNNKVVTLDLNLADNQHWDYAFAYTLHAKQGGENVRVVAHMESYRKNLTTQQAFYVAISRAEYEVRLIVDNQKACISALQKRTGEKTSALEALAQSHIAVPQNQPVDSNLSQQAAWKIQQQQIRASKKHSSLTPHKTTVTPSWNVEDIQHRLSEHIEALAKELLGEPNHQLSSSRELRYGKKGSLWIPLTGKYAGAWHSHESGERGNLIQLIQHVTGMNFKEALDYAGHFLGLSPKSQQSFTTRPVSKPTLTEERPYVLDEADMKAIAYARKLEKQSLPIQGTIAERYLREQRGITGPLPDTFRYHRRVAYNYYDKETKEITHKEFYPALVAIAQNQQQQTQGVQIIYLDPNTAIKAAVDTQKRTYGRPKLGAAVMVNPGQARVLLAEGPETGLSIAQAFPEATVMVTLSASNFRNAELKPDQKEVIICLDNDGKDAQSYQDAIEAARMLSKKGHTVYMAMPDTLDQDFNDVHLSQGIEAVRTKIAGAALFKEFDQPPSYPVFPNPIKEPETEGMLNWIEANEQSEPHNMTEILHHFDEASKASTLQSILENMPFQDQEIDSFSKINEQALPPLESYLEASELQIDEDEFNLDI